MKRKPAPTVEEWKVVARDRQRSISKLAAKLAETIHAQSSAEEERDALAEKLRNLDVKPAKRDYDAITSAGTVIDAQHQETGRLWRGRRENLPPGYKEMRDATVTTPMPEPEEDDDLERYYDVRTAARIVARVLLSAVMDELGGRDA
jgi:hypothetical protein